MVTTAKAAPLNMTEAPLTNSTQQDPSKGDLNFSPHLDPFTTLIAVPERGLLLERQGTVLSHTSAQLMTVIVTIDPIDFDNSIESFRCRRSLDPIITNVHKTLKQYEAITQAIFEAKRIFTTNDACRVLKTPEHCREKRIVGAYVVAGAALGVATTSLSLATANRVELEKMQQYIEQNQETIAGVERKLLFLEDRTQVLIDTQTSILGYVANLTESVNSIGQAVDCLSKTIVMERWANNLDQVLSRLLQFVLNGQTFGRLTPGLISPEQLTNFVVSNPYIDATVITEHPNILYQTATANLIRASFDNLQFTFLIAFPKFGKNPIYPFYSVKQIGFEATLPSAVNASQPTISTCLRFVMPDVVILHDNTLHILHSPVQCPRYGNVMICRNAQLNISPLKECLRLTDTEYDGPPNELRCPLTKCFPANHGDSFISTTAGILIFTSQTQISLTSTHEKGAHPVLTQTAIKTFQNVSRSKTLFVPWTVSLDSVSFGNTVVYAPQNADHAAKVSISNHTYIMPNVSLTSTFGIPGIGTAQIEQIIENQHRRLKALEDSLGPELLTIKSWASATFQLPLWLKVAIGIIGSGLLVLLTKAMGNVAKCLCAQFTPNQPEPRLHDPMRRNTLYEQARLYPSLSSIVPTNAIALTQPGQTLALPQPLPSTFEPRHDLDPAESQPESVYDNLRR